ncbi:MAG TPA: DUF4142 domain-containing protein [Daejeonella sp.]|nr:DUF4142 domain-containing protein [Daejeonella sp.]
MKRIDFLLFVLIATWLVSGCNSSPKSGINNQEAADTATTVEDEISEFLVKAAGGGMMEVQLGEIADKNANSQGVKNFGIMMIKDHGKSNEELKAVASSKKVIIPATIDEEHQKHIDELTTLRGAEFDEKYMAMMVEDHRQDIELFEQAAKMEDPVISDFANKTLPVLTKHLNAAQKIKDGLKISTGEN